MDCICTSIARFCARSAYFHMVFSEWKLLNVGQLQEQKRYVLIVDVKMCNVLL